MEGETLIKFLESEDFVKVSSNATRLIVKLKTAIQKEELYETHQILRTVYFRFVNSKERVFVLVDLLHLGACYLLKQGEGTSAQDLATLFLEAASKCLNHRLVDQADEAAQNLSNTSLAYHTSCNTFDLDICRKVTELAVDLPDTEIGQPKFIANALETLPGKILNRGLLHNVMAETFWQRRQYANSRYHYLHCASIENSKDIAAMLIEYQAESATQSEVDLFITQFTLQFLCLQNPLDSSKPGQSNKKSSSSSASQHGVPANNQRTRSDIRHIAKKIFSTYTLNHPLLTQVCIPFSSLPLLNFTYFIISIIDSDRDVATFKVLRDVYKAAWSRDPSYQRYLDRIGTLYFGVADPSAQQRQGGFLNNILASLFEGTDEEEDEEYHVAKNLSSSDELD